MSETRLREPALAAWLLLAVLISYGSLFPFRFAAPPPGAFATFAGTLGMPHSLGDVLGNVALFCPLGIVSAFVVRRWWLGLAGWTIAAAALAIGLQVAQIALPHRDATLDDAALNLIGFGAGLALGWLLRRVVAGEFPGTGSVSLLGLWAVGLLVPLVPELTPTGLRLSLAPLGVTPAAALKAPFAWLALLEALAGAYAVCTLCAALASQGVKSRSAAPAQRFARVRLRAGASAAMLVAGVLAGRAIVADLTVDWPLVLGLAFGFGAWCLRPRVLDWSAGTQSDEAIASALLGLSYALLALRPFAFHGNPHPFNWWPLVDLLTGGMLNNVQTMLPRLFLLGGCCWFAMQRSKRPWRLLAMLILGCVALEAVQSVIPGRTPSVTDAVLVLGCGVTCMGLLIARRPTQVGAAPAAGGDSLPDELAP